MHGTNRRLGLAGLVVLGLVALADGACTKAELEATDSHFDFTASGPPVSIPIPSGGSGTTAVMLADKTNPKGEVTFSAPGLPTQLQVIFNPVTTTGDNTSVSITVAPGTAPGSYPFTVRASGGGNQHDVTITVIVPEPPGFSLSLPVSAIGVDPGSVGSADVTINRRGNFAGAVSFLGQGFVAGGSSFSPQSTTGNTTRFSFDVPANTPSGSSLHSIIGSAAGLPDAFVTLEVFVRPPPPVTNISVDFSSCEVVPIWGAASDGSGAPVRIIPSGAIYQFPVTQSTATFSYVLPGSPVQLNVLQGTQAEFTAGPITPCFPYGSNLMAGGPAAVPGHGVAGINANSLSGTVSGVGATQQAAILWGNGNAFTSQASPNFTMNNVFGSPHALAGYRKELVGGVSGADRAFMRQNQAAGTGVGVDFNGAESAPVATANATVTGIQGGDQVFAIMAYTTEARCQGIVWYGFNGSAAFQITGIPASLQGVNDVHLFSVNFTNGNSFFGQLIRSKALGAFAVTRPTPLATPTVTRTTAAGYLGESAVVNLGAYNAVTLSYGSGGNYVSVTATKGFLGGATGTVSTPNLSGVTGWSNAWAPATGAAAGWSVMGSSNVEFTPACASGTTLTTAGVNGSN